MARCWQHHFISQFNLPTCQVMVYPVRPGEGLLHSIPLLGEACGLGSLAQLAMLLATLEYAYSAQVPKPQVQPLST